jgi:DedD protein
MRLPFFRAKSPAADAPKSGRPARAKVAAMPAPGDEGPVEQARTWARRRLIGALVLLVVGVVGFPILFETQPRPLPVDTPILLPPGSAPRGAVAPAPTVNPTLKPLPAPPADAGNESAALPAGEAEVGTVQKPAAAAPAAAVATAAATAAAQPAQTKPEAAKPEPAKPETARSEPVKADPPKPSPAKADASKPEPAKAEATKAPAALDAGASAGGRFVVQVGAFTDAERLKSVRQKLEKQGFKTYTQEIQTPGGKSTRVRIGPYANRQEADAVASKVKSGGLQANVLTL